ncbi:RHS repeat-associated core domain-containing protein [Burkholderia ubonensis]|uniref:RHS repeat-associated core domain-containing protein n=1 Tax=Burkholderia ubonensis TaxID=101571 RepID=UPI000754470B|nr:RHS repeat-associated core domain-containing protein [Burkholderia ubonensis]KVK96213.1 hypothetical protein WJ45_20055 [Burkholderia ubonensis]KVQ44344.1 hypothetical protein WK04_15560 [Burkholderia ubonensis]
MTYDGVSRPTRVATTDKQAQTALATQTAYDDFGRPVTRTLSLGSTFLLSIAQTYNADGQVDRRTTKDADEQTVLRDEHYQYDERRRLKQYDCSGSQPPQDPYGQAVQSQTFEYDAWNNLTSVTTVYDGGRNVATYQYDTTDPTQLVAVTNSDTGRYPEQIMLGYDANGRLVQDDAGRQLNYDPLGRLTKATQQTAQTTYHYDALDTLTGQTLPDGTVRELFYRAQTLVNDDIADGSEQRRYLQLEGTCLAQRTEGAAAQSRLAGTDLQHGLLMLLDAATPSQRSDYVYTPYGYQSSPGQASPGPLGFNGEQLDPATGVYHLGNGYRAYSPVLMRFQAPDSWSPVRCGRAESVCVLSGGSDQPHGSERTYERRRHRRDRARGARHPVRDRDAGRGGCRERRVGGRWQRARGRCDDQHHGRGGHRDRSGRGRARHRQRGRVGAESAPRLRARLGFPCSRHRFARRGACRRIQCCTAQRWGCHGSERGWRLCPYYLGR